ncbi:MerR family transcriptional regulator [Paracoccus rhizosphaerae]|uniref:DNA-binding protein n=1 Tax=Paracoccus rhizosphaerae TaxID=1133347 RepID=A0ABV6CEV1_9RHOB|nr:DNA-binding protein [Paracoccus rhizosphaerae]
MSETDMKAPPLDVWRLDAVLEPAEVRGKLWGLPSIAAFLGISETTARRWAKKQEIPIYQPPGTMSYCAFQNELRQWRRTKPLE